MRSVLQNERKVDKKMKVDMMIVFDMIVVLIGVYMGISSFYMKKSGEISSAIITKEELNKCKKKKEFIQYIYWKEMLFGAVAAAVGILGVVNRLILSLEYLNIITMLVFLAAFLWFWHELGQAREKFLH